MNNQEKLKSHKKMYSWIKEKGMNGCTFYDEDDSDWVVIENRYPELMTLVEDLISDLEKIIYIGEINELRTRDIDPDFIDY